MEKTLNRLDAECGWYDIYETAYHSTPIQFKNNKLHSVKEKQNRGIGLRVNRNGCTGFSYTNNPDELDAAVVKALALSKYGEVENLSLSEPGLVYPELSVDSPAIFDADIEIEKGRLLIEEVLDKFPQADVDVTITRADGWRKISNSKHLFLEDIYSSYNAGMSVSVVADDGSRIETWSSLSSVNPVSINRLSKDILRRLYLASETVSAQGGKIPIILTSRGFSSLLGLLLQRLNAKSIYKKVSPYEKKMDTQMFHPSLTVTDNPLIKNSPYSYRYDDEGVVSIRKNLVDNGKVKAFISDIKYATLLGTSPSGNSRRSYSTPPQASFSTIEVVPGDTAFEDMISSVEKAVLVDQFLGLGQSNTITGDFSANLDLAFYIEKGEVRGRVKDCMLSDNLFSLFARNIVLGNKPEQVGRYHLPYLMLEKANFTV